MNPDTPSPDLAAGVCTAGPAPRPERPRRPLPARGPRRPPGAGAVSPPAGKLCGSLGDLDAHTVPGGPAERGPPGHLAAHPVRPSRLALAHESRGISGACRPAGFTPAAASRRGGVFTPRERARATNQAFLTRGGCDASGGTLWPPPPGGRTSRSPFHTPAPSSSLKHAHPSLDTFTCPAPNNLARGAVCRETKGRPQGRGLRSDSPAAPGARPHRYTTAGSSMPATSTLYSSRGGPSWLSGESARMSGAGLRGQVPGSPSELTPCSERWGLDLRARGGGSEVGPRESAGSDPGRGGAGVRGRQRRSEATAAQATKVDGSGRVQGWTGVGGRWEQEQP